MKKLFYLFLLATTLFRCTPSKNEGPKFSITFTKELSEQALDGRLLLLLAIHDKVEPRFQMGHGLNAQLVFGMDVNRMKPGEEIIVNRNEYGYPITSLSNIPAGEYSVQAVLNRYETYNLKNGKSVILPPDMGEGQQWSRKPGNLYSKPIKVKFNPSGSEIIKITLDQKIPPIEEPKDNKYVRHIKIQSTLLSDWWGRPTFVGAHVLCHEFIITAYTKSFVVIRSVHLGIGRPHGKSTEV